ncbi:MAG: class II fructose-bisphosphate aldolase [Deltaproteobacteria bacterium]|jgi:fructose-bisphosphate aldolase class II|nr:MAG: class II fructose-bisphosphate aldolase [Deltaproteobacteria bacterium]
MPLVSCREILEPARLKGVGVAGIDVIDPASTEGVISAAEALGLPVILMVPETAFPMLDVKAFFKYLIDRARSTSVPVAVHLDHGESIETMKLAIESGFTSVMIDGSSLPLDENIALTKSVVELAHAFGVSVEAEIGHVGGGEGSFEGTDVDEDRFTRPEDAQRFAEETSVDTLAVAFGTVHGIFKGTPKLDIPRLEQIRERVGIPLVMHGGSGLSDEQFVSAIKGGITKINLFTEISMTAAAQAIEHGLKKNKKLHFAELLLVGQKTTEAMASKYLKLFSELA